jgi:tripartite-type tricarboxylate transporter receptor subunit TctC
MSKKKPALPSRRAVLQTAGLVVGAAAASSLGPRGAKAAGYPERPVKIVVPFAPAGPTDIMARIVAQHLGDAIGGTVIVENKPGAGGNIGIGGVAHAEPDGYTLLITSSAYVVNPGLYAKIPYDPYKDFAPIAELGTSPNVILVGPKLGINSIADLIARAKANPDELNYASPGIARRRIFPASFSNWSPESRSRMCRSRARARPSRPSSAAPRRSPLRRYRLRIRISNPAP